MKITVATLHKLLLLDAETGRLFWKRRDASMFSGRDHDARRLCSTWNTKYAGKEALASRSDGYCHGAILGHNALAHRVVFAMTHGYWPTTPIDHINCVRDDNRPCNLREATLAQNAKNSPKNSRNTSGIKGVSWSAANKRWVANVSSNGQHFYLGGFRDKDEAAKVVQSAREKLHGAFARHD